MTAYVLFYSEWLSMQFTNLVRQYDIHRDPDHMIVRFIIICTMHLHTLLTESCTHGYSYIADDTIDTRDGGRGADFRTRRVYMSILTLWFFD